MCADGTALRNSRLRRIALSWTWLLAAALRLDADGPPSLVAALRAALDELPRGATAALVVEEVGGGRVFEVNAAALLKPASVLKLFTSSAALLRLGGEFEFRTEFRLQGQDLLVISGGDPGFGDERIAARHQQTVNALFDRLAESLRARGVREIHRIAIDDRRFDAQWRHPDWPEDQADQWYQAPVGALVFNDNCVDSIVRMQGDRLTIELTPSLPAAFIRNELRIGDKGGPVVSRALNSDVLRFSGAVRKTTALGPVCVRDPSLFVGHALKTALDQRGIPVRDEVVRRSIDSDAQRSAATLFVHVTSIRDVLWRCNVFSQNLFAECLLKSVAAYGPDGRPTGHPGSWERGGYVVRKTLADSGIDMEGAVLRDGSGLSHENRVSASQIVAVLQQMGGHPCGTIWRENLAQPGRPGTLQNGYSFPSLKDRFVGKTGSIANVRALAGYLKPVSGRELAFALLINGPAPNDLRPRIAKILAEAR